MSIFDPIARAFWRNKYLDADAYEEGVESGKAQGRREEYDAFWDSFQQNGNRRVYAHAFAGEGWTSDTFKPKYPIAATGNAEYMFSYGSLTGVDLIEHCRRNNIIIDLSKATVFNSFMFYGSPKTFPTIDTRAADSLNGTFRYAEIEEVEKIILRDDGTQFASMFDGCQYLRTVTIEGVIGKNCHIHHSTKLDVSSMKSIISALKNYAGTEEEFTQQIKFSENCWTNLEASGVSPSGGTWKDYVMKLGWLI